MVRKNINVDSYTRTTKSGKVVQVEGYSQNRNLADALSKMGRTPVAARSGQYPGGRSLPGSPAVSKARSREMRANLKAVQEQRKAATAAPVEAPKAKKAADALPPAKAKGAPTPTREHRIEADNALQRQHSAKGSGAAAAPQGRAQRVDTSPEGLQKRGEELGAAVAKAVKAGQETQAQHATMVNGKAVYTPERARQHRELIQDVLAEAASRGVPRERKAVLAGGLGGAGKSTTLRDHAGIDQSGYITVNPDDVKEMMVQRGMVEPLPGYSPMEMAGLIHEESSDIAKMLGRVVQEEGLNVIWDVTLAGKQQKAMDKMQSLKDDGYSVRGVFVDIPPELSVQRAMARYERGLADWAGGKGDGGRFVHPDIIMENAAPPESPYASLNRENFEAIKGDMVDWQVYDNSVTGAPPRLIGRSEGPLNTGAPIDADGVPVVDPFASQVADPLDSLSQAIARLDQIMQELQPKS